MGGSSICALTFYTTPAVQSGLFSPYPESTTILLPEPNKHLSENNPQMVGRDTWGNPTSKNAAASDRSLLRGLHPLAMTSKHVKPDTPHFMSSCFYFDLVGAGIAGLYGSFLKIRGPKIDPKQYGSHYKDTHKRDPISCRNSPREGSGLT